MARIETYHHALNIGVFDESNLHRIDVDRLRLGAERQTNLLCDAVGRAFMRPGWEYMATLAGEAFPIDFVSASDEAYALLFSDYEMQVFSAQTGALVSREAVSTTITNGDFGAGAGWTLASSSGQTSAISGGKLNLTARAHGGKASASASASVAAPDQAVEHALRIVVDRGPVTFRLGTSAGADDLIRETSLRAGEHSLAFTPNAATIYITFSSTLPILKIVDSCQIEAAGTMSVPTIWPTAALPLIRKAQSLDVLFCACDGYVEQRIERRGDSSWSVVEYQREDGPFQAGRNADVKLTPSVLEGNGTLTSDADFFTANHVGAMFRLFHEGQAIDTYLAGDNEFTPAFLVTGITETNFEERKYDYVISGTWSGTLRNRRSFSGEFGDYVDYRRAQTVATIDITANASYTNDDNDDNIESWVKIGFPAGKYTSGEAHITVSYQNGGGYGICRVVAYNSPTSVDIEVLVPFKGLGGVIDWRQSRWDGYNGYPSAVAFTDGRLVWAGDDLFDASVSDAYESFNEDFDGDAGPLSRSIALGGRNKVRWALPLSSLMLGCESRIANVRASSLDEILTPDNFGMKSSGKIGAAAITPAEFADDRGIFVHNSGADLFEVNWSSEKGRYVTTPFSRLTTELFQTGITGLSVQTLPDQRLWVTNSEADAVAIVFEPTQQVLAAHVPISLSSDTDFILYTTVLPDVAQDRVFAVIKRVVNGATVYYLERMAKDSEAKVGTVCKIMDSFVSGTGAHSATIDLPHLIGRDVVAWVDGAPVLDDTITTPGADNAKVFTVDGSGQITLPDPPAEGYCVGLAYDWQFKSARLGYGVEGYTAMMKTQGLAGLGLLLSDFARSGVKYGLVRAGQDFATPYSLPVISSATGVEGEEIVEGIGEDEIPFEAGGDLGLDMRVCLAGRSPKPVTIRALVLEIETYGR